MYTLGMKSETTPSKAVWFTVVAAIIVLVVLSGRQGRDDREQEVKSHFSYLDDLGEVSWWRIDKNNIYIGFSERPKIEVDIIAGTKFESDPMDTIVRGAAVKGNKATDFGFHAWGVVSDNRQWRPGDGGFWVSHTARHGKIQ